MPDIASRFIRLQCYRLVVICQRAIVVTLRPVDIATAIVGLGVFRIELYRLVATRDGEVVVLFVGIDAAFVAVPEIAVRVVGIQRYRLIVIRQRAIVVTLRQVDIATAIVGPGVFRIELYRLVATRDGEVVVMFVGIDAAFVAVPEIAVRVVGIQRYRLIVIRQRAIIFVLRPINIAPAIVGISVFRIEGNGMIVVRKRTLVVPLLVEGVSTAVIVDVS